VDPTFHPRPRPIRESIDGWLPIRLDRAGSFSWINPLLSRPVPSRPVPSRFAWCSFSLSWFMTSTAKLGARGAGGCQNMPTIGVWLNGGQIEPCEERSLTGVQEAAQGESPPLDSNLPTNRPRTAAPRKRKAPAPELSRPCFVQQCSDIQRSYSEYCIRLCPLSREGCAWGSLSPGNRISGGICSVFR